MASAQHIRIALPEADAALPVVKDFIAAVKKRAIGESVLKSVTPGPKQVVKIVHDVLVDVLESQGSGSEPDRGAAPQLMAGSRWVLQDHHDREAGETPSRERQEESSDGIARRFPSGGAGTVESPGRTDRHRDPAGRPGPAAGGHRQAGADRGEAGRLRRRLSGYRRAALYVDEQLMAEVAAVRETAAPRETLLVADSMTGQDAVMVAKRFQDRVGLSGIVLTPADGDTRGGAALSMRQVTGKLIKFLGTGEKMDALEPFRADRVAGRILGMGDVVSLVERAAEMIEQEEAENIARKMRKGEASIWKTWRPS